MKILYVEDNEVVSDVVLMNLEDTDFDVEVVRDAETAIDLLSRKDYDLLLVDFHLPKKNGCQLIKELEKDIPIIFLTGDPDTVQASCDGSCPNIHAVIDKQDVDQLPGVIQDVRAKKTIA